MRAQTILCCIFLGLPITSQATLVTYEFEGVITEVDDPNGNLADAEIAAGTSTFKVSFSYDTTDLTRVSGQDAIDYQGTYQPATFMVTLDDSYTSTGTDARFAVINDDADVFFPFASANFDFPTPPENTISPENQYNSAWSISLLDWDANTLDSISPPTSFPAISQFEVKSFQLDSYWDWNIHTHEDGTTSEGFGASTFLLGEITSLTVESEPEPNPNPIPESQLAKTSRAELPLGTLKIWNGSEFVLLSSSEGQDIFDATRDSEVLVHGWNGAFADNTPLKDKWIVKDGFTQALESNPRSTTNILAYDWTEAANSRQQAISNLAASQLGFTAREHEAVKYYSLFGLAAFGFTLDEIRSLHVQYDAEREKMSKVLDDRWVPNEQVSRQATNLVQEIIDLIIDGGGSGDFSFYGHSLGAGIVTEATDLLLVYGMKDRVSRLTLFDAPVDTSAALTSGQVYLDGALQRIRARFPDLPIDNYWSSAILLFDGGSGDKGGYGKAYVNAANIESKSYGHSSIASPLFKATIEYNTAPSQYPFNKDIPQGIGYDDPDGDLIRARTGTNCRTSTSGIFGAKNPFDGLDSCRSDGFTFVEPVSRKVKRQVLNFDSYLGSSGAKVSINPETGLPILETGSPVFVYADFLVTEDLTGIEIDFDWLTRFDGDDFRIWVQDTLVYSLDAELASDGLLSTGLIGLDRWLGESVTLMFGVLSDFAGSTVAIRDLRFVQIVEASSVPVPSTLLLLLFGAVWMGRSKRVMRH